MELLRLNNQRVLLLLQDATGSDQSTFHSIQKSFWFFQLASDANESHKEPQQSFCLSWKRRISYLEDTLSDRDFCLSFFRRAEKNIELRRQLVQQFKDANLEEIHSGVGLSGVTHIPQITWRVDKAFWSFQLSCYRCSSVQYTTRSLR